jgi:hypothetical protein
VTFCSTTTDQGCLNLINLWLIIGVTPSQNSITNHELLIKNKLKLVFFVEHLVSGINQPNYAVEIIRIIK